MTRGKFVLITEDDNCLRHYYISTEFNGNMYISDGYGSEILDTYTADNISSVDDWKEYIDNFNQKYFQYNDTYMYREITETNCKPCINFWYCSTCMKRDACYIIHDFENVNNLFDITSYKYYSDYMYWLNLTTDDVEVKTESGIVRINSYGGAVFNYSKFLETKWDSGLIDLEDSYEFDNDEDILHQVLTERYKQFNLDEYEVDDIITEDYQDRKISYIYDSLEELGKCYLRDSYGIPEFLEDYINYESYAEDMIEGDDYYLYLESSGRVAYFG